MRISKFTPLSSTVKTIVESAMGALDKPDVPTLTTTRLSVHSIFLHLMVLSPLLFDKSAPTINSLAHITLSCELRSTLGGHSYFLYVTNTKEAAAASARWQ